MRGTLSGVLQSPSTLALSPQGERGRHARSSIIARPPRRPSTASSIRSNGVMPSRACTMAMASSSLVPWMVKKHRDRQA